MQQQLSKGQRCDERHCTSQHGIDTVVGERSMIILHNALLALRPTIQRGDRSSVSDMTSKSVLTCWHLSISIVICGFVKWRLAEPRRRRNFIVTRSMALSPHGSTLWLSTRASAVGETPRDVHIITLFYLYRFREDKSLRVYKLEAYVHDSWWPSTVLQLEYTSRNNSTCDFCR